MNKDKIIHDFNRAAKRYDQYATLQLETAKKLVKSVNPKNKCILDLGCGTGFIAQILESNVIQLDIALLMCEKAVHYGPVMNADIECLPVESNSIDIVTSNLCFQWLDNLSLALNEIHRVLKPGGEAYISTFGPATLQELRILKQNVLNFKDKECIISFLEEAKFINSKVSSENRMRYYPNMKELLTSIRGVGGQFKSDKVKSLKKSEFQGISDKYKKNYSSKKGVYATWEIIYIRIMK